MTRKTLRQIALLSFSILSAVTLVLGAASDLPIHFVLYASIIIPSVFGLFIVELGRLYLGCQC